MCINYQNIHIIYFRNFLYLKNILFIFAILKSIDIKTYIIIFVFNIKYFKLKKLIYKRL